MRIVFFGGSKFSQFYLEALKSTFGEVFSFHKLPSKEEIEKISPDVGVIAYFGYIVPEEMLKIPRNGFINVHYSLLPRWRGPAPVQSALLAGDKEIGVTILIASKKVDAGAMLAQEKIPIFPDDTYLSLEEKLIQLGSKMLLETLPRYLEGNVTLKIQKESRATYSKKINKSDGLIDWSKSAEKIERMVRAYDPWPGTFIKIENKILKIKKATVIPPMGGAFSPGIVLRTDDGFPAVVCGKGALKLLIVQPEGKSEMSGDAYLRGHKSLLN